MRSTWLCLVLLLSSLGCRDAFTSRVDFVAEAGNAQLTVERLSEVFAQGKALALKRDVIDRMAGLWVDYSLFTQRSVAGDSLLDSVSVVTTLWPEVQQRRADHFHDGLMAKQQWFDSARIDSTYVAGEYRLLQHILLRTEQTTSPPARDAKRRQAVTIRARLSSGGSWAEANRSNEDPAAKASGGSLGVLARGEFPGAFENAAWGLAPGAVSDVVETPQGFHIVRRPTLKEQRPAFAAGLQDRLVERMDSAYLAGLGERRHVRVKRDAAPLVRGALANPARAAGSTTVLGTFDGGRFTVGDLVRWINAMPSQVQQQVIQAGDGEIDIFVKSLMRNQALMVEADSAGIGLTPLDIEEFRDLLRRDLAAVRKALGLDDPKLATVGGSVEDRQRMAALYVDSYLEAVANNKTAFASVPPFLAERLRGQYSWHITPAGVERVLERSTELRAMMDSMRVAAPPAPATDSGGSDAKR